MSRYGAINELAPTEKRDSNSLIFKKFLFIAMLGLCEASTIFSRAWFLKDELKNLEALEIITLIHVLVVDSQKALLDQNSVLIATCYKIINPARMNDGATEQTPIIQAAGEKDGGEEYNDAMESMGATLNTDLIGATMQGGWTLSVIISSIFSVIIWTSIKTVLKQRDVDEDIYLKIDDYFNIAAVAFPFILLNQINERFLSSIELGWKQRLAYSIAKTVIGIFFNYQFIRPHKMKGAAWAVLAQEICALTLFIGMTLYNKKIKTFKLYDFRNKSRSLMKKTLQQGWPICLAALAGSMANLVTSIFIHRLGKFFLAINHAIGQCLIHINFFSRSFSETANRLIAKSNNLNNTKLVQYYGNKGIGIASCCFAVIAIPLWLARNQLVNYFIPDKNTTVDDSLIKYCFMLKIAADFFYIVYDAANQNLSAIQKTQASAFIFTISTCIMLIPSYILASKDGHNKTINQSSNITYIEAEDTLYSIYGLVTFGNFIAATLTCLYWRHSYKKIQPTLHQAGGKSSFYCCRSNTKRNQNNNIQINNDDDIADNPYAVDTTCLD